MGRKKNSHTVVNITEDAEKSLLSDSKPQKHQNGNIPHESNTTKNEKTSKGDSAENKKTGSAWRGFAKKVRQMWPFVWPASNLLLQLRVAACCLILVLQRFVNIAIPYLYKLIVDSLTPTSMTTQNDVTGMHLQNDSSQLLNNESSTIIQSQVEQEVTSGTTVGFPWELICVYMLIKAFQGGSGYLNILRSFLWISVAQNTQKKMRLRLFSHLHHLSMRWHLQRKTGEVIRVMDRGANSITMILNHVLFNIFPVIFDIVLAIVFFVAIFNIATGIIVFATMAGYLACTISISEWRTKFRRGMNEADNKKNATSVDSILNFETVKYYSAEDWETDRYEEAIDKHQEGEWKVNATANLLSFMQKTLMILGLLGGSLLCAWYVYQGKFTVGDYVMFGMYVEQLYIPLNTFGAYYRMLQNAFVDMENMFDMLEEKEDVKDQPNASQIVIEKGEIAYNNVSFRYDPQSNLILKNINFKVPAGHTYALVGLTGSGKSTIIRLLFRFYDLKEGSITIDGQDISKATQKSLRQQIGVVPQDTVLFNQDIRYNIRYGRVTATDDEVQDAARAADIHDKILTFHDGYGSRVGEKGLKVSGGEKQRIAIARTILKGPEIILLDEATSALDSHTERHIQESLKQICEHKTTIVVAHRLSTVIHAHQILFIQDGEIVERGRHEELLHIENGYYHNMWMQQLQSSVINDDEKLICTCCVETDTSNVAECTCNCHVENTEFDGISKVQQHGTEDTEKTANAQMTNKSVIYKRQSSVPLHVFSHTPLTSPKDNSIDRGKIRHRSHTQGPSQLDRTHSITNHHLSCPSMEPKKLKQGEKDNDTDCTHEMFGMGDNRDFSASIGDFADLERAENENNDTDVFETISFSNTNLCKDFQKQQTSG